MSTIGKLTIKNREGLLEGSFATLAVALSISLEPNGLTDADLDEPTHDVFAVVQGRKVNVGAGWTKTIKRGQNEGQRFISFTIDDPSFPAPLNLSAFPTAKQGELDVVWKRPRGGSAPRPADVAADIPQDEIPY